MPGAASSAIEAMPPPMSSDLPMSPLTNFEPMKPRVKGIRPPMMRLPIGLASRGPAPTALSAGTMTAAVAMPPSA